MALYFISGVSGTGKTTLMHELRNRGKEAHDTDVDCIRRSKQTGEQLNYERAKAEGYDWIYPSESLKKLKTQSSTTDIFLLGSIDNFYEVIAAADQFIWMTIPLNMLIERLDKREKEYGKSDSERQTILDLYKEMSAAIEPKVYTLDATKSVELIADDLLDHIKLDAIQCTNIMDETSFTALAAQNNAEWCETICNAHGIPGIFTNGLWLNGEKVPMYYPNVVTLTVDSNERQYAAIKNLIAGRDGAWAVKDSFANLDLSSLGFTKLFHGEWLLAPEDNNQNSDNDTVTWKAVSNAGELIEWENAWSNGDSDGLFKMSLLTDSRVRFMTAYENDKIVAGAILNASESVVGISNVFCPDENAAYYWRNCIRMTKQQFPGLGIVGYESGDDLQIALSAGFRAIGPLSVWALEK